MSDVAPCLWLATEAEAAAHVYISVFEDAGRAASIDAVTRWGDYGAMAQIPS